MIRRVACLSVLPLLVLLSILSSDNQASAQNPRASGAQTAQSSQSQKRAITRAAFARWAAQMNNPGAPTTHIGFLSAPQTPTGGAIFGIFPAAMGDFTGTGILDAVTVANTGTAIPQYNIVAAMDNGSGSFNSVLTPTLAPEQDPVFVTDLNGDGKDDVVLVHPAVNPGQTAVEAFISNGDGTFTSTKVGGVPVTTNGFVWATLVPKNGSVCPYVLLADAASPNANIWTVETDCSGNFQKATSVAITGALNPYSPSQPAQGVPGNPMVFADLNGDTFIDFAGPAATSNQINVYLCTSGTNPCTSYSSPVALTTMDSKYDSCFLAGGVLNTGGKGDLVTANCLDGNITVYVNNGTGGFAKGLYYPSLNSTTEVGFSNPAAVSIAQTTTSGHNDIVVTDFNAADIEVLLGNGDGTVNLPTVGYATGGAPLVPALVGNFNGSSNPVDVVLPDNQLNFVYLQGYGDGTFRSGINYYAEHGTGFQSEAVALASGDFNGDGIPDFVIGNFACLTCTTGITVFLSNADGTLQQGVNYFPAKSTGTMQYVAVADFNGDGKLDIAVTDTQNGIVQIFTGNGDGTFNAGPTFATDTAASPNPVGIVTADFNGDGKPDLAIINNHGSPASTANVGILINNGTGGFNPVVTYPLSTVATELTAADVNADSKVDLVVPLYGVCQPGSCTAPGSAVAILLGNGNGTFQKESDVALVNGSSTYLNPYAAAVADVNGDGKVDLVVTIQDQKNFDQGIVVAFGNGDGTFQTPTLLSSSSQNPQFAPPPLPGYVQIVDLNKDGIPDLVYTNSHLSTVGVMYGAGKGTFYSPVEFAADRWAWGLAVVDINGDGAADVVASGNSIEFSGVAALLNDGGSKTALISSANPSTPGSSVTFSATVASDVKGVTNVPSGTVTFFDGTNKLGSGILSSGVATFAATSLADGPHAITAQYSGDTNFVPTVSTVLDQSVGKADGVVSVALVSSANPSTPGQSITLTATVTDTVTGEPFVPTGKVTFNNGTTALGSVTLSSTGVAAFPVSTLPAGTNSITAAYSGDANFAAKTSAPVNQVVTVPDYVLASNPTSQTVNPGTAGTYKITVATTNGYNGVVSFPASACSALPTGATCSFSPSTATVGQSTTLTITTTAPTSGMLIPADVNPNGRTAGLMASLTGFGLMGIVLAGDLRKRKRNGALVLLSVLALALILSLVGCGGGSVSGGGGGGGGTPAGTYSVKLNVTGTAGTNGGNTAAHPLTVTLVVN